MVMIIREGANSFLPNPTDHGLLPTMAPLYRIQCSGAFSPVINRRLTDQTVFVLRA